MYTVLGITGSRPQNLPQRMIPAIQDRLARAMRDFKKQGGELVLQGGAIGVDQWAALAALDEGLRIHTYVPFPQQPDKWEEGDKEVYRKILENSSEIKVFGENYNVGLLFARNNEIVNNSDIMLGIYPQNAVKGGSLATVKYAWTRKPVIQVRVHLDRLQEDFHQPDGTKFVG